MSNAIDPKHDDLPSRDEILDTDDIELLREWLDDAEDIASSVKSQHEAHEKLGVLDKAWARRAAGKLHFATVAGDRIRRRLKRLGVVDA